MGGVGCTMYRQVFRGVLRIHAGVVRFPLLWNWLGNLTIVGQSEKVETIFYTTYTRLGVSLLSNVTL